jgi:predicted metal-dependent peptidase
LLACDAELAQGSPWVFESWEEFTLPKTLTGGGGTDFRPVFDWVEKQDQAPEILVYFSDCVGKFPDYQPSYSVIWLVKGNQPVPFGQRIQLN